MKKTPYGRYRTQARRIINGVHERKSFTAESKKALKIAVAEWQEEAERVADLPLSEAVRQYIDGLRGIRSPSTIRGYTNILHVIQTDPLGEIPIADLTQGEISAAVLRWATGSSPKTIKNRHGLISATLKKYRPSMSLKTALPETRKRELYIPTDADIKSLLEQTAGKPLELPVILAAFAGMRRGEIAALTAEDVKGEYIHIRRAAAIDEAGNVSEKAPKTKAGARRVPLPDRAKPLLPASGKVCSMSPMHITTRFCELMQARKAAGQTVFRFHDLRHFCASRLHALGVPDAYITQWLGFTDAVLKSIYRHALADEETKQAEKVRAYFERL